MAWVRRLKSERWQTCWRDPNGRTRTKSFRLKRDADRFAFTVEADKLRGSYLDPARGLLSLSELWAEHRAREGARLRRTTLELYDGHWRNHIEPALGAHRVGALTRADVEGFLGARVADGVGLPTVAAALRLLQRLLEAAVAADRIARNPARGVKPPTLPRRPERALTPEEVWQLADAVPGRLRAAILVLGWCGLRIGELAALRVERIDFLRRTIRVEEQYTEVAGSLHLGPTKTGLRRVVPAPAFVIEELAEHLRRYPARAGLVFTGPDGGVLRRNGWRRRVFEPARKKAGLAPMRPHDLRHTAVTLAISTGAPLTAVQALAGHASAKVTADRYAHLLPSVASEVAERLDKVGRRARPRRLSGDGPLS